MIELKEKVYNSLKIKIITQGLKPGEKINANRIMEEYGIGKTPLREVFLDLQRDGLIKSYPRSGTLVSSIDIIELRDASPIRVLLEGLAGELAVKNISEEQLARCEHLVNALRHVDPANDLESLVTDDTALHNLLYEATGNKLLHRLLQGLQCTYSRYWFSFQFQHGDMGTHIIEWESILEALKARDGEKVKRLLVTHVENFLKRIKDIIIQTN